MGVHFIGFLLDTGFVVALAAPDGESAIDAAFYSSIPRLCSFALPPSGIPLSGSIGVHPETTGVPRQLYLPIVVY